MKKKWYYRLLLSYIPIFFVTVLILTIIFFTMLKINSKKQIIEVNELFVNQIVQMVDSSLKMTEQLFVKEFLINEDLKLFFSENQTLDAYQIYKISQAINNFLSSSHYISSIYLYKTSTEEVLTNNSFLHVEQFADKDFIREVYRSNIYDGWTDPRIYNEFFRVQEIKDVESIVSLVKRYPLNAQNQGIIVVNGGL